MQLNRAYRDHLRSAAWKAFCVQVKTRDEHRCVCCNIDAQKARLEVHHRTYERLGHEVLPDCYTLCRECHRLITGKIRRARYRLQVYPSLHVAATTLPDGCSFRWDKAKGLPPLEVAATTQPNSESVQWNNRKKDNLDAADCQVPAYGGQSSPATQWAIGRSTQPVVPGPEGSDREKK